MIESLPLPPAARRQWLQRAAEIITHWQHRNHQARTSHVKQRLKELEAAHISLDTIPRCRSA